MSTDTTMTMANPLYEAQRALFQGAVRRAHPERVSLMRRLIETVFGRLCDHTGQPPESETREHVSLTPVEMLRYSRPF